MSQERIPRQPDAVRARWIHLAFAVLLLLPGRVAAFSGGQQTFHVLGNEFLILRILKTIDTAEFGGNFLPNPQPNIASSIISMTVPAAGQTIVYDHGEDGLEADLYNPVQASTQIWGDGNPANGAPPGFPLDLLNPGNIIQLQSRNPNVCPGAPVVCNPVPINPRGVALRWDGQDVIFTVGQPMTVVHTVFPADGNIGAGSQTVFGGTWEIFAKESYQNTLTYTIPVGVDTYANGGCPLPLSGVPPCVAPPPTNDAGYFETFKHVYVVVQATEDNTPVVVDNQAGPPLGFILNAGQSWSSQGLFSSGAPATAPVTINQNTTVTGGRPLQVGLVTGNAGAFGTRFYNIVPTGLYASEYMTPVFSGGGLQTDLYVNNPNIFPITVTAQTQVGGVITTKAINVPANGAASFAQAAPVGYVPNGSSVRLSSPSLFWGVGAYDTGGLGGNGTGGDWGWVLQANGFLENAATVPHGPGNSGVVDPSQANAGNGSPVWVGVLDDNTTVTVDWNGDGTPDQADINNDGVGDGTSFTRNALQSLVLYDPSGDNDQAPARIQADGKFSASWGYSATGGGQDPGLGTNVDWGYSVNPFDIRAQQAVLDVEKTASPKVITPPAVVTFTLRVSTFNLVPVNDVDVTDTLPAGWTYVPGSAQVTYPNLTTVQVDPMVAGQVLTWNLSQTLQTQEEMFVVFQASVPGAGCTPSAATATEDWNAGTYTGGAGWAAGSNWVEAGEATNPGAGNITIAGGGCMASNHLELSNDNDSITRIVDTSAMCTPQLSFTWQTLNLTNANEQATVQASVDGVTYRTLRIFQQPSGSCQTQVLDLRGFQSASTRIRFTNGSGNNEASDTLLVDDVLVSDPGAVTPIQDTFQNPGTPANPLSYMVGVGWSGNWIETGDDGSPTGGDIRIQTSTAGGACAGSNRLVFTGGEAMTIQRRINLAGFVAPQLTFTRRSDVTAAAEFYHVEASTDGAVWTTLQSWGQAQDNAACDLQTYDLTPYIDADGESYLRFRGSGGLENAGGAQDNLWIDDVTITETGGAGAPPPFWDNLAAATGMLDGFVVGTDDTERVYNSALSITKAVSLTEAKVGDTLTYTLTVTNSGGVAIPGVVVRDPVPAFTTLVGGSINDPGSGVGTFLPGPKAVVWDLGALNAGQTRVCSFQATINQVPFDKTPIKNLASLVVGGTRLMDSNEVTTLIRVPIFLLIKKAPGAVSAGQDLRYDFDLFNNGGAAASGVFLRDRIPADTVYVHDGTAGIDGAPGTLGVDYFLSDDNGVSFGYVPAGPGPDPAVTHIRFAVGTMAIASLTTANFTVQVAPATPPGTVIRNFAFLRNNETTVRTTNIVETVVTNLQLTLRATQTLACPRRRLNWFLDVTNNGGAPFDNVVVVMPIPTDTDYEVATASAPGAWTREYSIDGGASYLPVPAPPGSAVTHLRFTRTAPLPASTTETLAFDTRVSQFVPAGAILAGQATISATTVPTLSSNQVFLPTINIRVVKAANRLTAPSDGATPITYTLRVDNVGAVAATGASLVDPVAGFNVFTAATYVPASAVPATPFAGGGLTWALPTLVPLAPPLVYSFQTTVNTTAPPGTSILNVAEAVTPGICQTTSNVSQVLVASTGVSAGPTATGYGDQGQTLYFPSLVTNEGGAPDVFDLTFLTASPANWPLGTTLQVYWDVDGDGLFDPGLDVLAVDTETGGAADGLPDTGTLAPGAARRLLIAVTIPAGVPDLATNDYTITATSSNDNGNFAAFVDTVNVIGATYVFLKEVHATAVPAGVEVTWKTAREFQNRGFEVYRSPSRGGPWERVDCCLIPGMGTFPGERDYQHLDDDPPTSGPLYYRLADIDFLGRRRQHPPVGVDRDGDGLAFDVEEALGLSDADPTDAAADPDGDGLSIAQELALGRDPFGVDAPGPAPLASLVGNTPPPDGVRVLEQGPDRLVLECFLSQVELVRRAVEGREAVYPTLVTVLSGNTEIPGWPQLPLVGHRLPAGRWDVALAALDQEVEEGILVGPAPTSQDSPANLMPVYAFDPAFYGQAGSFPAEATMNRFEGTGQILVFQPFTYDHGASRLIFRRRIRVVATRRTGLVGSALVAATDPGLAGLPAGPLYRLRTAGAGLHRITGAQLAAAGADPAGHDPRTMALYRGGVPIPMRIQGEGDGVFDPGDALEFYAWDEGDRYAAGDGFHLLLGAAPGLRWSTRPAPAPVGPYQTSYRHRDLQRFRDYYSTPIPGAPEEDRFVVHSGKWVNNFAGQDFPVTVADPAPGDQPGLVRLTYGASLDFPGTPDHHHLLRFDGTPVADQTWDGSGFRVASAGLAAETLTAGAHTVRLEASLAGLPAGVAFDFLAPRDLELEYDRELVAQGGALGFDAPAGGPDVAVRGFNGAAITVLDVSAPQAPVELTGVAVTGGPAYQAAFGRAPGEPAAGFLAFEAAGARAVTEVRTVNRTGLRAASNRAGWVAVVRDASFEAALAPLVTRRAAEGLEPMVVRLEDLADEFTGGVVHPESIRRFLAHAHQAWARAPDYLLLAGDGNANPRAYPGLFFPGFPFTSDPVLIPTPLSMSGPGFLRRETPDDGWYGRLTGADDLPEVAVGRLTVKTPAELAQVATKIAGYDGAAGGWQTAVLSVTDDGEPLFPQLAEAALAPLLPGLGLSRFQLGDPSFPTLAAYTAQLHGALGAGALLVQFVGHGSFTEWTDQAVVDVPFAAGLGNGLQLPFVISMTCEDAYFGDVTGSAPSLGEAMVLNPGGGAVAFLGSGIQTTAAAKDLFHRSLMEALMTLDQRRLGDALRTASGLYLANSSDPEDLLRAFNLLGDPATTLRLANPLRPGNLQASLQGNQIVVRWDPVTHPDLAGYEVYRRSGSSPMVQAGTPAGTSLTLPLNPGAATATEYFTVRAVTSAGLGSALAPEVGVATGAATVPPPLVGGGGGGGGGCQSGGSHPAGAGLLALAWLALAAGRRRRRGFMDRGRDDTMPTRRGPP